ncbi:nuclease [Rhynchospora pubera]|uniref:Nuclease n=1 Tax=Rhynchospora pubera TaxID=906938 RepID=A0AAV8DV84_9POAL|nr:nuclease [Rhynchospora pubera]
MEDLFLWMMEDEMWFSDAVDTLLVVMLKDESTSLHFKQPQNARSLVGFQFVNDILTGHPMRCYNIFRMTSTNFHILCQKISSSLNTKKTSAEEQLAIFLLCVGHGCSIQKLAGDFQHSAESIYGFFKDVLKAILSLRDEYIKVPDSSAGVHPLVGPNSGNYLFKDALGAIDGIHIQAVVKGDNIERFRNRKGFLSQNVLAACSFDMLFQYVAVGWEGSASDMRILRWALEEGGFDVPTGRYYLADFGYTNTSKFLSPYKNHPYHLAQFNRRPRSSRYVASEDLYNHRHAQLRNVIERTFGVLKMRFKVLDRMPKFQYRIQTLIVMACCILHNFIKLQNSPDYMLDTLINLESPHGNESSVGTEELSPQVIESLVGTEELSSTNEKTVGEIIRSNIRNALWRKRQRTN